MPKTLWTCSFNSPSLKLEKAEYIVEFEGHLYRIIRGTKDESDKILTISEDSSHSAYIETYERVLKLVDCLCWQFGISIQLLSCISGGFDENRLKFETTPVGGFHPRSSGYLYGDLYGIPQVSNDKQQLALNLWNEAQISKSPFLSFINYWNILEIDPPKSKPMSHTKRIVNWINNLPPNKILGLSELSNNLEHKYNYSESLGQFLYDEGRNAIVHLTKPTHYVRFKVESIKKIEELNKVMQRIAKFYIHNQLKLPRYSIPLNILKTKKKTQALKYLKNFEKL